MLLTSFDYFSAHKDRFFEKYKNGKESGKLKYCIVSMNMEDMINFINNDKMIKRIDDEKIFAKTISCGINVIYLGTKTISKGSVYFETIWEGEIVEDENHVNESRRRQVKHFALQKRAMNL